MANLVIYRFLVQMLLMRLGLQARAFQEFGTVKIDGYLDSGTS